MSLRLDERDKKILEILQEDARTSYVEIARKLKIGETAVRYRVRKLRKRGVITRFIALLDPRKIGLAITAIVMANVNPAELDKTAEQLASFGESHHIFQSTGEYDLIAIVHAKDMTHLNQLMKKIKALPGIRNTFLSVVTYLAKVEPRFKLDS